MAWIRSAFWIGEARPDMDDSFRAAVENELIPALRTLPGVDDAQALWPRQREDDPPRIACQILVHFASRGAMHRMMTSPERLAMRERVRAVAGMFDGSISHIDYEVGAA